MSESLAAAASALGMPEDLLKRSAEAKARALGGTAEDFLTAWAGGSAPPTPKPVLPPPPAVVETHEAPALVEEPSTEPAVVTHAETSTAPPPRPPAQPPVLEGRNENPLRVLAGAVGIVALAILLGLFAASIPVPGNGVYTSAVPLSDAGKLGRAIYLSEGCASCHTQMVRPIVADAGLGGVTISDTNQVLGNRRVGPDLTHVGSRMQRIEMSTILTFSRDHPSYRSLGTADLESLVTYLKESR